MLAVNGALLSSPKKFGGPLIQARANLGMSTPLLPTIPSSQATVDRFIVSVISRTLSTLPLAPFSLHVLTQWVSKAPHPPRRYRLVPGCKPSLGCMTSVMPDGPNIGNRGQAKSTIFQAFRPHRSRSVRWAKDSQDLATSYSPRIVWLRPALARTRMRQLRKCLGTTYRYR